MPHSLEAERSLLGGCIIENDQILVAREVISTPKMFFREVHGDIWAVVDALDRKNYPADLTTVVDELRRTSKLEKVGGPAYVASLVDGVPRSTNVEYYARLVKDYSLRRSLIFAGNNLTSLGYEAIDTPVSELVSGAESTLLDLSRDQIADGYVSAQDWAIGGMQQVRHLMEHKTLITGLPTGFNRLDYLTRGLQPGNLIVIAGRPAMGKTALAMQIARRASKEGSACVVSQEMTKGELWMRALAGEAEVDLHKILTGDIDEHAGPKVMDAAERLEQSGFFIDETAGITAEHVRSRSKRLAVKNPLQLLVIDYLQLMDLQQHRGENLASALGRTTKLLKQVAKELHIPIILLSQLSRGPEGRTDKRPILSDLRESGAIEQDADVVFLMYRDDYYNPKSEMPGMAEVIIAKQRNGPTGTVELYFVKKQTRFTPWSERPQAS
jgi:replicative DNA helicase